MLTRGVLMNYAKKISSPLGDLYLIANEEALIALDITPTDLYEKAIKSETHKILNFADLQLTEYFQGLRIDFDLPLALWAQQTEQPPFPLSFPVIA